MIRAHKYTGVPRKFNLSSKERARASEDGVVILVRQQQSGTFGVFAIDVSTGDSIGTNWYESEDQTEVPEAIRFLNRDLDKFYGRGGLMSDRSRMRDKRVNVRKAFERALAKQASLKASSNPNSLYTAVNVLDKVIDSLFDPITQSSVSVIKFNLSSGMRTCEFVAGQIKELARDLDRVIDQFQKPLEDIDVDRTRSDLQKIRLHILSSFE
jgi:hypothetical protein